jgi:segregation and condensation protein B
MDELAIPAGSETEEVDRAEPPADNQTVISMEEFLASGPPPDAAPEPVSVEDTRLKAIIEAVVYVTEEPLTLEQISSALAQPIERVQQLLSELITEYDRPEHGVAVREVAGGFKVGTKPEHHDAIQDFVKNLKPPLKLSLPALETLSVIAYKQPVTAPEVMAIRGVQGASVLKTLLDRKLIAAAGRKNVIGRPILYRTTKDFLVQFGLKDLTELPTLRELEDIRRMAFADDASPSAPAESEAPSVPSEAPSPEMGDPQVATEEPEAANPAPARED